MYKKALKIKHRQGQRARIAQRIKDLRQIKNKSNNVKDAIISLQQIAKNYKKLEE